MAADIKPRSRDVTDGIEKTASRGMLRAVGMGDDDWVKPQVAVASSWNEVTPCNLSLDRLAEAAKQGVHAGGGYPLEFGTISVSDGIAMGHEGMHFSLVSREVIADSVETVMQAERLDGSVLLAGCDKSLPGMLMAAARLNLSSVFLYAGSIAPGWVRLEDGTEKQVTIIDAFEAVGACKAGKMSQADLGGPIAVIYSMAALGALSSGLVFPALLARGLTPNAARKTSMLFYALLILPIPLALQASSPWTAAGLIGLALFAHQGFSTNIFGFTADTVPTKRVATVMAIGGVFGNLTGMGIIEFTGWSLTHGVGYWPMFAMAASAYLLATLWVHVLVPVIRPIAAAQ